MDVALFAFCRINGRSPVMRQNLRHRTVLLLFENNAEIEMNFGFLTISVIC